MSTPAAAQAPQVPQDPELMQASFNALIEALTTQRDGALQGHAGVLSELRVTQVLKQRAEAAVETIKADLKAAQDEITRLNSLLSQKSADAPAADAGTAEAAQTAQPASEAAAS